MRIRKFIAQESITPGNTISFDCPHGRYLGILCRLTGTTDTGQTLALSEIGKFRVQRNGETKQSQTFEFYHEYNDLVRGFPEATLPTAGATAVTCFIPFSAPNLPNSMEVVNDDELKLFFEAESGLSTEFGSNAITVSVVGILDTEVPERYSLEVFTQHQSVSATGQKAIILNKNNIAFLFAEDASSITSSVEIKADDLTIEPSLNIAIANAWANMEWMVEASGNNIVPYRTGSGRRLGSYLNNSVELLVDFSSTGTLNLTGFSLQRSPQGRVELSANRVRQVVAELEKVSRNKLLTL